MISDNNLWDEIKRINRRMDSLFSYFTRRFNNQKNRNYRRAFYNLKENEKEYVFEVELPGVEKNNIKMDIINNRIQIRAEKKTEKKQENERTRYYSSNYVGFMKTITIPEDGDKENIEASYKNGILKITIPKKKPDKREVKIN